MSKKNIASDFLHRCSCGDSREAFRLYVHEKFLHHNAYFKGDRESLMLAMEANAQQMPNKVFEIQRILEDGDLVVTHARVQMSNPPMEIAVVHIFRFEGEKIAELWDLGQPVPAEMPNEHGMF